MSDIVERLRDAAEGGIAERSLIAEAAAEIERLRAEVEELNSFIERGMVQQQSDGWAKAAAKMHRQCEDMAMMIKRLVHRDQTIDKAAMEMVERFDLRGTPMRRAKK